MYRILLVDDEPLTLDYLTELIPTFFTDTEVTVLRAGDGVEALILMQELEVDILMTDIRMPEMDGMQLIGAVHQKYRNTFLVLLSGYEEFAYAHEAIRYGVSDYLLKPIVPQELAVTLGRLRTEVDRRREEQRAYHNVRLGNKKSALDALERLAETGREEPSEKSVSQVVAIGKRFIASHYHQQISLSLIAEKTGVTESYFSTIFHRETGEGYARYLTRIRMENAARLLRETPLKVYQVAERVGYISGKHFNYIFKQWFGVPPNEYQKRNHTPA